MQLDDITPLILTYNEAPNIERTLAALTWAREVIVIDSFSNDATLSIAASFANVRTRQRRFDSHAAQWNFGLREAGIKTPWVLALDADHVLEPAARAAIARLDTAGLAGVWVPFAYRFLGTDLGRALYPPVLSLYRRDGAVYEQQGHTQRVRIDGATATLGASMTHDDRKSLARWVASQQRYARLEARWLHAAEPGSLSRTHRVRRWGWVMPWLAPLVFLLGKGGVFKGRAGWAYALQRMVAESLIALHLAYQRVGGPTDDMHGPSPDASAHAGPEAMATTCNPVRPEDNRSGHG